MTQQLKKRVVAFGAGMLIAAGLASCAADTPAGTADGVSVDVGLDAPIVLPEGATPEIAVFYGTGSSSVAIFAEGIDEAAAEYGANVTYFDSKFDPTTELNQMQTALQSGKYNAWIVIPFDSNLLCQITSKDAPEAGIVVVTVLLPVCGRDVAFVDDIWTPGTLAHVNGENTPTYRISYLNEVFSREEGPHQVLSLVGPPLTGNALGYQIGIDEIKKDRPDLDFVEPASTNFSADDAFTKTQNLLQSHPDADVIVSTFSDMAAGAVQAIKAAGRTGINVYTVGNDQATLDAIAAGDIAGTVPTSAGPSGYATVQAIAEAFQGKEVKRFWDTFANGTTENPFFIDKDNYTEIIPEY